MASNHNQDRRHFLSRIGLVSIGASIGVVALGSGVARAQASAAGGACVDLASLPFSQKNRRRGLGYVETAPDAKKRCGLCAFFTAGQGDCGTCQMLSGGAVSGHAYCNSFAPKQG
ncbi:MAG TPA: high-potential iron-sulfur protein [Novosphingobium sp.]